MKRAIIILASLCVCLISGVVSADIFGSGANQFTIDFVNISGDASSSNGTVIGGNNYTFSDPADDYRMGTYEVTNDQWNKFTNAYGTPIGNPTNAYDEIAYWTGTNVPTNKISWYESAQFVNWLNTSTGHQAAYKFTGYQGTSGYSLAVWESGDAGFDSSNPYRNSNAYYFLPTDDEWVKAAYWNGTNLQTYATIDNLMPIAGVDTNYGDVVGQPWNVGNGSEELNGTFDMMGNLWEWMESPWFIGDYTVDSTRAIRGGSYNFVLDSYIELSNRSGSDPEIEPYGWGFRVASVVPEPGTMFLLGLGGLILRKRK